MKGKRWLCAVMVGVFAAAPVQVFAVVGRYLPDLPVNFPNPAPGSQITAYGPVRMFDQPVRDEAKNINAGEIKFDYATSFEEANAPATWKAGGVAIEGGFFANPGVTVKPGWTLGWVQTVTATNHGANNWGLPTTGFTTVFPDATPTDPRYGGANPGGPGTATLGFEDYPNRSFPAAGNSQDWLAELGLVCISNTADGNGFRDVRVINTFLYGFSLTTPGGGGASIANVVENAPHAWSDGTGVYLNALNTAYDGQGPPPGNVASSKYRFENNDNCFIPEPATLWLLLLGGWAVTRRRK